MPKVTLRRSANALEGRGATLMVKVGRQKLKFKNGEEASVELKPGKQKIKIYAGKMSRLVGAALGFKANALVHKFRIEAGQDYVIDFGIKKNKFWVVDPRPVMPGAPLPPHADA